MPPPQASAGASTKSVQERLLELAQSLQFAWFLGHMTLLFCAIRYGLSYMFFNWNSRWAIFSYRTLFLSATVTYGIVVYKSIRSKSKAGRPAPSNPAAFIADENTQYLVMSLIWLFTPQVGLAVAPYAIYSVFHVATYTRNYLLPILQPQASGKSSPLGDTIGRFVKDNYDSSMTVVSILEIVLWFRILGGAIFFMKGSWILLLSYTIFFRIRHLVSTFTQGAVAQLTARADGIMGQQNIPPAARNVWMQLKSVVKAFADATDPQSIMAKQQGGQPKKAQ